MQVLYQMDVTGSAEAGTVVEHLDDFDTPAVRDEAAALAQAAWTDHEAADALATELAPKWPTYRQPPVDRAILRLAHHEIVTGRAPMKVAINEAVELAKTFAAKESPAFINGVLDKMAKRLAEENRIPEAKPGPAEWLDDAKQIDA